MAPVTFRSDRDICDMVATGGGKTRSGTPGQVEAGALSENGPFGDNVSIGNYLVSLRSETRTVIYILGWLFPATR